jgi:hypothetical protein
MAHVCGVSTPNRQALRSGVVGRWSYGQMRHFYLLLTALSNWRGVGAHEWHFDR